MRGTAVIACAVGGQPEIVSDRLTGFLVPPKDVAAIAAPLLQLLSDRKLAEKMGQAGRERALTHFSEAKRTDRFIEIYEQMLVNYRHSAHSVEVLT